MMKRRKWFKLGKSWGMVLTPMLVGTSASVERILFDTEVFWHKGCSLLLADKCATIFNSLSLQTQAVSTTFGIFSRNAITSIDIASSNVVLAAGSEDA